MSRILIVTPAPPKSRKGNRHTASRWAKLLRSLGHTVSIQATLEPPRQTDLLIALHARKSARAISDSRRLHPNCPIVLILTGTDLYQDIRRNQAAKASLDLADRLVVLQPTGLDELTSPLRKKTTVILQSAVPPRNQTRPLKSKFEVCVSGHLRPVKDPFRAAMASRSLPEDSRIQITHLGAALSESMQKRAVAEMARNRRYRWLGEVEHAKARHILSRSQLLVLSSKLEGGANVISEAVVCGVPILSSRISGSIGLLGENYEGYFEVGDTDGLSKLMQTCEQEPSFLAQLQKQCADRAYLFTPEKERVALRELLLELKISSLTDTEL